MTAHLLGIGNVIFSFVGIIGALYILKRNENEPFVRANARSALNMQITWVIFAGILFAVYLVAFSHVPPVDPRDVETGRLLSTHAYWTALALVGLIVASMFVTIVFNVIAAFVARAGRVYRYPIAIPFVRSKNR